MLYQHNIWPPVLFAQNAMLPAGYRQRDQTKKSPTGPFDRDALMQHLEKQALECEDKEDLVPFTGEKKGGHSGRNPLGLRLRICSCLGFKNSQNWWNLTWVLNWTAYMAWSLFFFLAAQDFHCSCSRWVQRLLGLYFLCGMNKTDKNDCTWHMLWMTISDD